MLVLRSKGENSLRLLTSAIFVLLQPLSNIGAESGAIKERNWQSLERNLGNTMFCLAKGFCCFKRMEGGKVSLLSTDSECQAGNKAVVTHSSFAKLQSVKRLSSSPVFTHSHVSLSPLADPGSPQRHTALEVKNSIRSIAEVSGVT